MDTKAIGDLEMLVVNNMTTGLVKSLRVQLTNGREIEGFVSHYQGSWTGAGTFTVTPFEGGQPEELRWSGVRHVEAHLSRGEPRTFVINP